MPPVGKFLLIKFLCLVVLMYHAKFTICYLEITQNRTLYGGIKVTLYKGAKASCLIIFRMSVS